MITSGFVASVRQGGQMPPLMLSLATALSSITNKLRKWIRLRLRYWQGRQTRPTKANQAFGSLNAVRVKTEIRILKSNVLSVLLYGSECWKMTKEICKKLDTFQTNCLQLEKIRNEDLLKSSDMEPISACVKG